MQVEGTAASSHAAAGPTVGPASDVLSVPHLRIWTGAFVLLCVSGALSYFHQGLLGPILPLYVSSLGYSEFTVGLVVAAFSITSFLLRPLIGQMADTWSVRGVFSAGGLILGVSSVFFITPFVLVIGLMNALRGIGWAAMNTGGNTLLAHTAPSTRRAEAASFLSVFHNGPAMLAPPVALGLLSATTPRFEVVFLLAAVAGLLSAAIAMTIPRPPEETVQRAATSGAGSAEKVGLIDRGVLLATVLLVCLTTVQPAINAFVPLYAATQLGLSLESLAWYYLAAGSIALLGRLVLGRLCDQLGRGASLVAGFGLAMLGMLLLAVASNLQILIVAGMLFTIGSALHQPSTMALAMDRADPRRRGRAMASYSLGYQVGVGFGAMLAGALIELSGYRIMYAVMVVPLAAGVVLTAVNWRSLQGTIRGAGH